MNIKDIPDRKLTKHPSLSIPDLTLLTSLIKKLLTLWSHMRVIIILVVESLALALIAADQSEWWLLKMGMTVAIF